MPKPNRLAGPSAQEEWDTYAHIGEFIITFSFTEAIITTVLASLVGAKDAERFELVARGLDIRVKCERMRAAIGINRKIGPNMEARLKAFEKTLIKMRNKMLHSWAVLDAEKKDIIHLASMSKMPTGKIKPPKVSAKELAFLSYWMSAFNSDLIAALDGMRTTQIFETDHPRSHLPPGAPPKGLQEEILAILGKPPQTEGEVLPKK